MKILYKQIHNSIESCPVWSDIKNDRVLGKCSTICEQLKEQLDSKESVFGLRTEIVDGTGGYDHTWIKAHHPEIGEFMIDPTIRQILFPSPSTLNPQEIEPIFIGTRGELAEIIQKNSLIAFCPEPDRPMEYVWTQETRPHSYLTELMKPTKHRVNNPIMEMG